MHGIHTFLWFNNQAEEAATFYTSLFEDGRISLVDYWGSAGPGEPGTIKSVHFELAGHQLMALNAGPHETFNESISLMVRCDTQAEVDFLWERLTDDGEPGPCGWLKDRYGLSWQVVPELLFTLVADPDAAKSQAVMASMLQSGKLESAALQSAYDQA